MSKKGPALALGAAAGAVLFMRKKRKRGEREEPAAFKAPEEVETAASSD